MRAPNADQRERPVRRQDEMKPTTRFVLFGMGSCTVIRLAVVSPRLREAESSHLLSSLDHQRPRFPFGGSGSLYEDSSTTKALLSAHRQTFPT